MLGIILFSNMSIRDKFINLVAYLASIMLAIILHEFAHGFIAMKNGDYTAKTAGRLTLNPVKHFDIMGILMFVVVGIGWARPVPVNPNYFKSQKKGIFTVAIAGVVTNFIIALISAGFLALLGFIAEKTNPSINSFGYMSLLLFLRFFMYSVIINASLIAFNILPIFPLDGFRVVEAFTKPQNKYCVFMRRYGVMVLFGLMLLGNILGRISPFLDIFGLYITTIRNGIVWLFEQIFRLNLL